VFLGIMTSTVRAPRGGEMGLLSIVHRPLIMVALVNFRLS
jgi:hypothetical protein